MLLSCDCVHASPTGAGRDILGGGIPGPRPSGGYDVPKEAVRCRKANERSQSSSTRACAPTSVPAGWAQCRCAASAGQTKGQHVHKSSRAEGSAQGLGFRWRGTPLVTRAGENDLRTTAELDDGVRHPRPESARRTSNRRVPRFEALLWRVAGGAVNLSRRVGARAEWR